MADEINEVTMPKLGETVTEGTLSRWLKEVGQPVAFDDPLFEGSTDKVDSEIPSPYDGYLVEVHTYRFSGNGRAMNIGETDGMVKVVARKDGPILGMHVVGPWASELLAEGYLAVNWEATPEEVGHFIHPHPSLSEAIGETMLTFTGRSMHG